MSEFPWEEEEAADGLAAEEVPETPAPVRLRDCLALVGPDLELDPGYPVGVFQVAAADPSSHIHTALIAIAEIEDRVVVAVPFNAWHRTIARRFLPANSLLKPLPLTVDLVDRSLAEGEEPHHFETAKVWAGVLAPQSEHSVIFEEFIEVSPDFQFSATDPALVPSVASLSAAYQQHFSFVSAGSGADNPKTTSAAAANPVEDRLKTLEQSVQSIAASLQKLTGQPGPSTAAPLPTTRAQPSCPPGLSRPSQAAAPPGLQTRASPAAVNADDDIVGSARMAGVPEHQIQEMLKLATRGRTRLADLPQEKQKPQRGRNVLSETEDEDELVPDVAGSAAADPLSAAVTKLTEIASHLTLEKKKS